MNQEKIIQAIADVINKKGTDDREFLSEDELIEAYNEKFPRDGDTQENEVKYVRVIVKRQKP